jgi:FtsP/CotA-like multicopper oxidase with cupredoxin domain
MKELKKTINRTLIAAAVLGSLLAADLQAVIPGLTGNTFNLTAKSGYIDVADGDTVYVWGYADEDSGSIMQYPGPTLILTQGDNITVNLKNQLDTVTDPNGDPVTPPNVSIVFPGQQGVAASGGQAGLFTQEAPPDGNTIVTYTFEATHAGTYLYNSGTRPELQVEMGLVGTIIVRPTGYDPNINKIVYEDPNTAYHREYLFLLTEMDPRIHEAIEFGKTEQIDNTTYFPVYWFINGRNAPDTMSAAGAPWLLHQPYNCLPLMHPGENLLMRFVGAGRHPHPFHPHGNNFLTIARDARLLQSAPGAGIDLAVSDFTQTVPPGATLDAIFTWTGKKLGWDIYGHEPNDPNQPYEYMPDHGKPFPVDLPAQKDLAFGTGYSGSPFLGVLGALPPGQGIDNLNGGYFFMWHSHNEREMVNNDIFPGGLMTMLIIEHPDVEIP